MTHSTYLLLAFLLQIGVISAFIPRLINNRFKQMMKNHPPAQYPKLYPMTQAHMQKNMKLFMILNSLVLLTGLAILTHAYWTGQKELLGWDTQGTLTAYFFLQLMPFMLLGLKGMKYHQMMSQIDQSSRRTASLKPRKLTDYVSVSLLWLTAISALIMVLTIVYMHYHPFQGFAGLWNLLYMGGLNLFFFVMIFFQIRGKKTDPHQSIHDRSAQIRLISQVLVIGWLAANLFMTTNMWMSWANLHELKDVVQSVYFTFIILLMSQTSTFEPKNYSVYQTTAT
ncbi:MAG: hypothetical protein ACK5L8_01355 [Marinicella pacifica]